MKRIRIKRRASESSPTRVPQCFHRIGCDVLRRQAIAHYMRLRERGDHAQADNLTREYLRNKDFHVESWIEREGHKVAEIPTTGAYTLNKSLPSNLSFTEERDSKIRSH